MILQLISILVLLMNTPIVPPSNPSRFTCFKSRNLFRKIMPPQASNAMSLSLRSWKYVLHPLHQLCAKGSASDVGLIKDSIQPNVDFMGQALGRFIDKSTIYWMALFWFGTGPCITMMRSLLDCTQPHPNRF